MPGFSTTDGVRDHPAMTLSNEYTNKADYSREFDERYGADSNSLETDSESVPSEPNVMKAPQFTSPAIKEYITTRFTHLLPSLHYMKSRSGELNPFPALKEVSARNWNFILCAMMAWTWDAFDFFTVTMNVDQLSKDLNASTSSITMGITLVLMVRSAGAVAFGVVGDKYGTRWPLVVNLLMMAAVQVGFSFVKTYEQFLGVRACFGFVMGGIYGSATATALSDCPSRPRGFVSGLVQQGYALGYLLAVIFNRALGDNQKYQWRAIYWFAACISVLIALWRGLLSESNEFIKMKRDRQEAIERGEHPPKFLTKARNAFKTYWLMAIYLVLLMAGFNFMSHGSQDLYPTYLKKQLKFSNDRETVTMCVTNIGALVGGLVIGHLSTFIGRRLSIIICCIGAGIMVYPWGFVHNNGINAAVFFMQFFVQGAFGIVPAHLTELAHPDFKVVIVGLAYQLGNLASSASSTIESQIGEQFPLPGGIYNYGKVMAIFVGCVLAYLATVTLVGPENSDAVRAISRDSSSLSEPQEERDEKAKYAGSVMYVERV